MKNLNSEKELKSNEINFELITLTKPVHSVYDVQIACNCTASEVIKTLVFIGSHPILVVLPGDKMADINKIKNFTGEKELRMAKPAEVLELTGYGVGAVSPFGINSNFKQIADKSIFDIPFLFLGSGESNILIKMSKDEFLKAFRGDFI
jgi:Cys-tRNA(Pro) deacylase